MGSTSATRAVICAVNVPARLVDPLPEKSVLALADTRLDGLTALGSFFSTPTATLENLEVHVTTLNPGQMPHPPHRHPNEEMLIIDQGTVETLSAGVWKTVGPGSVIFNGSNQLHGLKNIGTTPAIYHVINFKTAATPAGETVVESNVKPPN